MKRGTFAVLRHLTSLTTQQERFRSVTALTKRFAAARRNPCIQPPENKHEYNDDQFISATSRLRFAQSLVHGHHRAAARRLRVGRQQRLVDHEADLAAAED